MKRLAVPLALALLLSSCTWRVFQFASVPNPPNSPYAACGIAGIDAEDVSIEDLAAYGIGSVRRGDCNGDPVVARLEIYVQLWHNHPPAGGGLCEQTLLRTWGSEYIVAKADLSAPSNLCDEWTELQGGTWRSDVYVIAFIEGGEYHSGWESSGDEARCKVCPGYLAEVP